MATASTGTELTREISANLMMLFDSGDKLPYPDYFLLGRSLFMSKGPMYCKHYPKTKWIRWQIACSSADGFIGYCSGIRLFKYPQFK